MAGGDLAVGGDEQSIGGKAAGLVRLTALGLNVPPFLVVPSQTVRAHLSAPDVSAALGASLVELADVEPDDPRPAAALARSSRRIRSALSVGTIDHGVERGRIEGLEQIGDGPYAVRSSMAGEDSVRHSFAGQLDSSVYQGSAEEVLESMRRGSARLPCA